MIGMDSHNQAAALILPTLHCRLKVPAVQEHSAIAYAGIFIGVMIAEHHKRIVLMAGRTPHTAHALYPGAQLPTVKAPLHQMVAVEGDHVHVGPQKVQAEGGTHGQFPLPD